MPWSDIIDRVGARKLKVRGGEANCLEEQEQRRAVDHEQERDHHRRRGARLSDADRRPSALRAAADQRGANISEPANERSWSFSPWHRPPLPSRGPPRRPRCSSTGRPTSSGLSSSTSRLRLTAAAPCRRRTVHTGRTLRDGRRHRSQVRRVIGGGADQRQSLVEGMARPGRHSRDTSSFRPEYEDSGVEACSCAFRHV